MNTADPVRRFLLASISLYQGLRSGKLSPCRFQPTCSEYAAEAITLHGSVRGSLFAVRRVLRCHPHGARGFDPVPSE